MSVAIATMVVAPWQLHAAILITKTSCVPDPSATCTIPDGSLTCVPVKEICTTTTTTMFESYGVYGFPDIIDSDSGSGGDSGEQAEAAEGGEEPFDPCAELAKLQAPAVATKKGNPIDISTGIKIETDTDFVSRGLVPLTLKRRYNSFDSRAGIFGRHWESSFDFRLEFSGASDLVINLPGRGAFVFVPKAGAPNTWQSPSASVNALVVKGFDGKYTLTWEGDTIQVYGANGKAISVKNQQGVGYDFSYNAAGYLDRVTSTGGRYVQFTWTGNQLTKVTDPAGNQHQYIYLADRFGAGQHLLQKVDYAGTKRDTVEYMYTNATFLGALTGKKFGLGRYSWFEYDSQGRATSTRHDTGGSPSQHVEKYTFAYSSPNATTLDVLETNPLGKQASYRFVGGELESVTGLPSVSCPSSLFSRTRDANGFTDKVTDFNDKQTDIDFDSNGRLVREVFGFGAANPTTVEYQWDSGSGRLLSRTVLGDHSVAYTYDAQGRPLTETTKNLSGYGVANQQRVTTYSYTFHPNGLVASATQDGPLPGTGDAVTRTYSTAGDLLAVSDSLGAFETFSNYSGLGLPGRMVARNGAIYDYTYDAYGRRLTAKRTAGAVVSSVSWEYDGRGRVTKTIAPDGLQMTMAYDDADRLISRSRAESLIDYVPAPGETVTQNVKFDYSYNANSDLTQSSAQRKQTVRRTEYDDRGRPHLVTVSETISGQISAYVDYDELGRLKARRGNHGQDIRFSYDDSDYLTTVTDSLNRATNFEYDAQNRVKKSTNALGDVTLFSYDAGGRVATATDSRGLVTSYQYDGFGQLWRVESPDTGVTTFNYDAYGRLLNQTKADLGTIIFAHDSMGRLVSRQSGGSIQTLAYDSCANGTGRLCSVTDASGATAFSYTPVGLLAGQTNTIGTSVYSTTYTYDAFDRLSQVTYPDGKTATYGYQEGQLRTISATPNGATQTVVEEMRYQPTGQQISMRYGNGLLRTQDYDSDGRLTAIEVVDGVTAATVQGLTLSWNAHNEITAIANARDSALSQSYGFDELGRLVSAGRGSGVSESFSYDPVGNRTSYSKTGQPAQILGYDGVSNRLLSSSQPRLWTYDANGNSNGFIGVDGAAVGLHYDAFSRVDSSSQDGQATIYKVNGLGQRVSKSGPNGVTHFIYAPDGSLLAEYHSALGWTDYVRVENEVVSFIRGNSLYAVHNDQVNRPELVTSPTKAVLWSGANYAFDRTVSTDSIGGLNIGFPGQYFDQETGLWQNYFRDGFDASVGRYVQSDPAGLTGGWNSYVYSGNSPILNVDPSGLVAAGAVLKCVWAAGSMYLTVDGIKAAKQDFDALRKKRLEEELKAACERSKNGAVSSGDSNKKLTHTNGLLQDLSSAFAQQGATAGWRMGTLGLSSAASAFQSPHCAAAGFLAGAFFSDGSASRKLDGYLVDFVNWLGDDK